MNNIVNYIYSIIYQQRSDIEDVRAQRVLALKLAIAPLNFAGPILHQYLSVAVDFCIKIRVMILVNGCAIKMCLKKVRQNCQVILWHETISVMSTHIGI